jgi:WD40 repeat protein
MPITARAKPRANRKSLAAVPLSEHDLGAPAIAVVPWGHGFVFAAGDGALTFVATDFDKAKTAQPHAGAVLCAAVEEINGAVISGGDDGRVCRTSSTGDVTVIARAERRWIEHVAVSATGALAWSSGKRLTLHSSHGQDDVFELAGSVGGLAFSAKSSRLAASHAGGISIYGLDAHLAPASTEFLEWKGGYVGVSWSPDERYIVAPTWDGAVRGWRLRDGEEFTLGGYQSPPRSLSWSARGNTLVTSGAQHAVLWSLRGKNALSKPGEGRAWRPALVSAVAFVSHDNFFAVGYSDGAILLAQVDGMDAILVRPASRNSVVDLVWSRDGRRLAYCQEDGNVGIADFTLFVESDAT